MAETKDMLDTALFGLSVDVVVLTVTDDDLRVVLVRHDEGPHAGRWGLPGGALRPSEPLEAGAARALRDRVGLDAAPFLEQLGAYSDSPRDPGTAVVTVGYLAVLPEVPEGWGQAGPPAAVPVAEILERRTHRRLVPGQRRILRDGVDRARAKLESTPLAVAFVGPEFTLSQLRGVYEAAWGRALDPGNFRRKVLTTPGLVVPTGRSSRSGPAGGKPAETYTAGDAERLDPPISRPRDDERDRPMGM